MAPHTRKRKTDQSDNFPKYFESPKQGKKIRLGGHLDEYAYDESRQSHKKFLAAASGRGKSGRRSGIELVEAEIRNNVNKAIEYIESNGSHNKRQNRDPELSALIDDVKSALDLPVPMGRPRRGTCRSVIASTVTDYIDMACASIKEQQRIMEKDLGIQVHAPTRWAQDCADLAMLNQKAVEHASLLINTHVDPTTSSASHKATKGGDDIERMVSEWFQEASPAHTSSTWGYAAREIAESFDWYEKLLKDAKAHSL